MIANELLMELRSIRRNYDWSYNGSSRMIRGKLKSESTGAMFDPIGAVCFAKTGVFFSENDWMKSAECLELSHIAAADLTAAANNVSPDRNEAYLRDLRRQMIGGVLLQPESDFNMSVAEKVIAHYLPMLSGRNAQGSAKF